MDLPKPREFTGPEGIKGRMVVTQAEKAGGTLSVHARLEYEEPIVVGGDRYAAWRGYLAELARAGADRCIVTMTAQKELE